MTEVRRETRARSIEKQIELDAPPHKIWQMLTDLEELVRIGTSQWEGTNLVSNWELNLDKKAFRSRSTYSNIQEKSVHMEEFIQTDSAPEQLIWKADETRK
ncbi:MAG TPA: hypothetical protein VEX69_01205 [Candidatus Limnocylindria bacterium]|nr:hypothetical protein [Candidatus Limnocylindria bacterium]